MADCEIIHDGSLTFLILCICSSVRSVYCSLAGRGRPVTVSTSVAMAPSGD